MLSKIRFYFEVVSLPAFIILALHLASSGIVKLMGGEHHHEHDDHLGHEAMAAESLVSIENIVALLLLMLFVWIWHTSFFKQWVPCSHTRCHKEQNSLHIIASIALCAHFFPEAEMRQALLLAQDVNVIKIASSIGFFAHFIVDVMIAVFLSLYWQKRWQIWLSLASISSVWIATTLFALSHGGEYFSNGFVLLVSSFLLTMFIHKPHRGSLKTNNVSPCTDQH